MKRRALVSVSDKRGIEDFARQALGDGVRDHLHRGDREGALGGRSRGDPRLRGDGRAGDTRRPGQDAAPQDPRRHPRRPRRPRPRAAARRAGYRPDRPGLHQPLPLRGDRRRRRLREGGHRADRHRRASDAAGRGQELRVRDGRPLARVLRRGTGRPWRARDRSPRRRAGAWRSPRSGGPPRYDAAISAWLGEQVEEGTDSPEADKFPSTGRSTTSGSRGLRYGENPHQEAAYYAEVGQSICSAAWRSCRGGRSPSTTSTTWTPPAPSSPT